MPVKDDIEAFKAYEVYQSWSIFIILLLSYTFVFLRLKFRVDFSGTLTLLL